MSTFGEEPIGSDAEFSAWLDRQAEQAHRAIAAVYDRAHRGDPGAHVLWPPEDAGGADGGHGW